MFGLVDEHASRGKVVAEESHHLHPLTDDQNYDVCGLVHLFYILELLDRDIPDLTLEALQLHANLPE